MIILVVHNRFLLAINILQTEGILKQSDLRKGDSFEPMNNLFSNLSQSETFLIGNRKTLNIC